MARKKENIIEQLYEVTGWFWPVGFIITLVMAVLTMLSINWCLSTSPSVCSRSDSTTIARSLANACRANCVHFFLCK